MKSIVITCNTIRAEVDLAISNTSYNQPVLYLESGLHNEPQRLNKALQETLDRISNVEQVLLIMGFCGNAILGLKPNGFKLVVPRADDCITLLLGSENRRREIQKEKATYFLSKGWIDMFENIEKSNIDEYRRMEKKYGKERAKKLMATTMKHYERLGIIDLGNCDINDLIVKAKSNIPSYMNLPYETITSSISFIEKFLLGPWIDKDNFIIFNSGEEITFEKLYTKSY